MRHPAQLFGLAIITALLITTIPATAYPLPTISVQAQSVPADRKAEADRLLRQGIQRFNISQFRGALQSWQEALTIYREIGVREAFPEESRAGEGTALGNLGAVYENLSRSKTLGRAG